MVYSRNTNLTMIPDEKVANVIYSIRGQRVMLDIDLAKMYGVTSGRLNEQVKRNLRRFQKDFMFQLTQEEFQSLRSQNAILKKKGGRGKHRKYFPHAFTEQGVAMLSGVLNSRRAIDVNVAIMRVFVKLKQILTSNKELAFKLNELPACRQAGKKN